MSPDTANTNWDEVIEDAADLTEDDANTDMSPPEELAAPAIQGIADEHSDGSMTTLTPLIDVGVMHAREAQEAIQAMHADASTKANRPTAEEIAAAKALLAEAGETPRDEPVSNSPEPIQIVEEAPRIVDMGVIQAGDVTIIASGDRIEYLRNLDDIRNAEGLAPAPAAPPPPVPRISKQILAEQKAGRAALQRHQSNIVHVKRAVPSAAELAAEGKNVEVFRPRTLDHIQARHMLNTPVSGRGEKY